jgi:hypothetical protein
MARSTAALFGLLLFTAVASAGSPSALFQPDPMSVQRYGRAYRYPQAGWIVLHIEGSPYERGYQHGRLLAPEILAYLRCSAAVRSAKAPEEGWRNTRPLVNALFLRRYEKEYLEEMKGIADGATAAGARFDNRPIDLVDIVGLNAWPELDTLDPALDATPTGLEGIRFPTPQARPMPAPKEMHCSAFAATGPATADGKVVIGHITMFGLYPSLFYNVWLDVQPSQGHRVLMQTYPAGIQSGLDYYLNDAGLVVCETTIAQTRFDIQGMALASRIRQALQYADTIDQAVDILRKGNNGLYTNEWLLADTKTNEIAMFELGTAKSKLYRSSHNDWFCGTEGFYWGCNNTKDLDVRLETIPGVNGAPANVVWRPSERDKVWQRLFNEHKGQINADFGKLAFTTPPLAAYHSLDAKFTTSDMARELQTWALFGPPLGRSWQPSLEERRLYPEVRAMASNPWTVLHPLPPPKAAKAVINLVDVPARIESQHDEMERRRRERHPPLQAAWHGTLLPKADSDIWLATAFADYERLVALEKGLHAQKGAGEELSREDQDRLAAELFTHRAEYTAAARAAGDFPLTITQADPTRDEWYRVAAGKGVLVLHELRRLLGAERFDDMMNSFGQAHAGKEVFSAEFIAHAEKAAGQSLKDFFTCWLTQAGLPGLRLDGVRTAAKNGGFTVEGTLHAEGFPKGTKVEITAETGQADVSKTIILDGADNPFTIDTPKRPTRVVVDKDARTAKGNGGAFSILSFHSELPQTLIVYGTGDEAAANLEAAETLQRVIREAWSNYTVPIKSDQAATQEDLRSHHLLLIGRPDGNRVVARLGKTFPVTFGHRSFLIGNEAYAHAGTTILASGENPWSPAHSVVVLAGLSAEATLDAPAALMGHRQAAGEVVVLVKGDKPRVRVVPPRELVWVALENQEGK